MRAVHAGVFIAESSSQERPTVTAPDDGSIQLLNNGVRKGEAPVARSVPALPAVKSIVLPEGEYTIRRDVHDSLVVVTGARQAQRPVPHPALATVTTLAATGMPIEELLTLCQSVPADGPLLGTCKIDLPGALQFDVPYRVSRRLLALERKQSRRFGAMDLLRFVATVHEPAGAVVSEVTYTWILPRVER